MESGREFLGGPVDGGEGGSGDGREGSGFTSSHGESGEDGRALLEGVLVVEVLLDEGPVGAKQRGRKEEGRSVASERDASSDRRKMKTHGAAFSGEQATRAFRIPCFRLSKSSSSKLSFRLAMSSVM